MRCLQRDGRSLDARRSRLLRLTILLFGLWTMGCETAMDRSRRYVTTVGIGAATLNGGGPPIESAPPDTVDFEHSFSTQASFGRRLGGPTPHMTLYADAVGAIVWGSGLRGVEAPPGCNVNWQSIGPALTMNFATPSPTSFELQGGMSFVHASRSTCAVKGGATGNSATIVSPFIGASIVFGLTPGVGWSLGGQWLQVPLDRIGIQTTRHWGGAGSVSVVLTLPPTPAARKAVEH